MKLKNETKWETRELMRVFVRCLAEVRKHEGRKWNTISKGFTVYVKTHHTRRHGAWVGGCAMYDSKHLTMKLPPADVWSFRPGITTRAQSIADTFLHEVGHCLGYRHNGRGGTIEDGYRDFVLREFADDVQYPVSARIERKTTTTASERQQRRYEQALANKQRAATRLKRAQTIFKKWSVKVQRYDRIFTAAAARGPVAPVERVARVKRVVEVPTGPNVNETGLKSLDKLGRDPRIEQISGDRFRGSGGYELWTRAGFCVDPATHVRFAESVRELIDAAKQIETCDCDDCVAKIAEEKTGGAE